MKATLQKTAENIGDLTAVGVTVGTLSQVLPAVAAVFTIIWTALRIYEMKTIQAIIKKIFNHEN